MIRRPVPGARASLRRSATFAACALFLSAAGWTSNAAAQPTTQWFFFDRPIWSPDSRQVAVIGRHTNLASGETFEDTLVVDVEAGVARCVSPSMNEITLSRNRRRLAGRGRWGIYDHELATASTRELIGQPPFEPGQIVTFGYSKEADALVAIRCDTSDPDVSGVYRWPVAGGAAEKMFSDPDCGPAALNFWQVQRREVTISLPTIPTGSRPVPIPGTDASVLQVDERGISGLVLRQGDRDTLLCTDCRSEYVSWPVTGGCALVATAPEDRLDIVGPGALWLVRPGHPIVRIHEGRHGMVVWSDSLVAYSVARPGRVFVVDAGRGTATPLRLSTVPDWVRRGTPSPAVVWTVEVQEAPFADFESARAEALRLKSAMGAAGFAVDPPAGGGAGLRLSVGSWPDSASAARQVGAVRKHRDAGATGGLAVRPRAAAELQGNFEFGASVSPDRKWRLIFRSHPHMFRPWLADEVWLEPASGDGRRRLALRATATF